MADPKHGLGRAGMTLAAVLATVGGSFVLAVRDEPDAASVEPPPPAPAPAPALELESWPTPVTTTRSSR